ncbi:MAG TPA: cupin domain-containing protein [Elusimicrobiota bacterium]|nr:cupin domain-containing protein [Elusimicrobiota bacterium]
MKKTALAAALILAVPGFLPAQSAAPAPQVSIKDSKNAPWALSNTLPVGAAYQLIYENPVTHGVELLVRFPSGYKIPKHYHSYTETVFIVSGKMRLTVDGKTHMLTRGSYAVIPAKTPLAMATAGWGSCEFVSSFDGPFDVEGLPNLLNAKDGR